MLSSKLNSMSKSVRMLNNGLNMLDEILQVRKGSRNFKGVGFDFQSLKKQVGTYVWPLGHSHAPRACAVRPVHPNCAMQKCLLLLFCG